MLPFWSFIIYFNNFSVNGSLFLLFLFMNLYFLTIIVLFNILLFDLLAFQLEIKCIVWRKLKSFDELVALFMIHYNWYS